LIKAKWKIVGCVCVYVAEQGATLIMD